MSNQVIIPFPQRRLEVPRSTRSVGPRRRAKILSRLSTARSFAKAVIEMLSYMGDARVKAPIIPAPSLPAAK